MAAWASPILLFLHEKRITSEEIILDTDKKTITVPHNCTGKLNAINSMIREFAGADAQVKTFSGSIDECWRYAMEHSDTQLKTAEPKVPRDTFPDTAGE